MLGAAEGFKGDRQAGMLAAPVSKCNFLMQVLFLIG